jgi:hypothetical protein
MKDITPEGSVVPIYLDPIPKEQMAQDALDELERQKEIKAKATAKAALLDRLGITADEAILLIS